MNKSLFTLVLTSAILSSSISSYAEETPLQKKVLAVMEMDHRNDADTKRDPNRMPALALEFFGLKQNMKVIEFAPGDGWYTKILAPLLKDKGELYLAYKQEWLDSLDDILKLEALSKARKLPMELGWNDKEYRYELGKVDFGMSDADMLLCIREYHNFNSKDKARFNKAAFDALKPGGIYVVVDHSRRHMAPETWELRRREDAVKAIIDIQNAGFKIEKSSDMFYRPDDELRYEVGRRTVTGNTDRFTLVFRKSK
ncbi:MAG: methyltransferase [Gammaproteobacteria bacterium]|nr:methyltransferase [Gammaproteobacteria bacterium]